MIRSFVDGGSYLIEATPRIYGIPNEKSVGERIYGPYHDDKDILGALKVIECSLPQGNEMHVLELGGQWRSWRVIGEKCEAPEKPEPPMGQRELASPAFQHQ